jgi:phospholipid transport system transporter-binding protein
MATETPPLLEPTLGQASRPQALLVLPAEITHAQAAGCLALLLAAARAQSDSSVTIVIDAAPLVRFDSSALAVLLECRRAVLQNGRPFAIRAMPARLTELARLYGVAELLDQEPHGN